MRKLVTVVIVCFALASHVFAADPVIQGHVYEVDKKTPIVNAAIEIYHIQKNNTVMADSATTDKNGYYKFDILKATDSYDILFSHKNYESSVVTRLAEVGGEQKIRKYLYKKGQKSQSIVDFQDRIAALSRIVFLSSLSEDSFIEKHSLAKSEFLEEKGDFEKDFDNWTYQLPKAKSDAIKTQLTKSLATFRDAVIATNAK